MHDGEAFSLEQAASQYQSSVSLSVLWRCGELGHQSLGTKQRDVGGVSNEIFRVFRFRHLSYRVPVANTTFYQAYQQSQKEVGSEHLMMPKGWASTPARLSILAEDLILALSCSCSSNLLSLSGTDQ